MGRPRTPTAVLESQGSFLKHPERRRARSHEPGSNGPIGDAPDYFDANHRAAWEELKAEVPNGVLARSDGLHLEITTRLLVKMRLSPARTPGWLVFLGKACIKAGMDKDEVAGMKDALRAAVTITPQELAILQGCLTRMGMTPADRSRVGAVKASERSEDPFLKALRKMHEEKQPLQ